MARHTQPGGQTGHTENTTLIEGEKKNYVLYLNVLTANDFNAAITVTVDAKDSRDSQELPKDRDQCWRGVERTGKQRFDEEDEQGAGRHGGEHIYM